MLKNLLNCLRFSGLWMGFVLNPYHWEFKIVKGSQDDLDDVIFGLAIHCGPIWIRVVIDDGRW